MNSTWTTDGLNVVQWINAHEGVADFDIQLGRLGTDGVIPIAKHVPTFWGAYNVVLKDTPPDDNYFLILLNSENSLVYSLSSRFRIFANGTAAASGASVSAGTATPTATVSGAPNPTMLFAQTYDVSSATGLRGRNSFFTWAAGALGVGVVGVGGAWF